LHLASRAPMLHAGTVTNRAEPYRESTGGVARLVNALATLRETVARLRFPLCVAEAEEATRSAKAILGQLDDYLLPRLGQLDAPLLVVVGGSTGAGKSTLVNSLIGRPVTQAGVLRPTTRAPVLVCHPDDAAWFTQAHLLPHLGRTVSVGADLGLLQVVAIESMEAGLALLDAPDIDSVVDSNRALAEQLLAAADLWLFVTTAARYADAVPWELLRTARDRGTAIVLVLDRVPGAAGDEIAPHLSEMLRGHDLGAAPLFVLPESRLDGQGLLAAPVVAPLREWLGSLARSAAARAVVVRQTVDGAIGALGPSVETLATAAEAQIIAAQALVSGVKTSYRAAEAAVEHGILDGALLHGEVLARWQELVGTGEFMRGLQARVGRLRDRVAAAVTGRAATGDRLKVALESGLVVLVRGAAADAAEQAAATWRTHPAGLTLLAIQRGFDAPSPDFTERTERMVRDWQRGVLELVRTEAGNKRFVARAGAYAVNALGLTVMIAVFTATAFIPTGAEIIVAGGTTIAAQKVLEAIFGDQAVRTLADRARVDLLDRVRGLLAEESRRFLSALDGVGVDLEVAASLRRASAVVQSTRAAEPLSGGGVG
jgi:hypothetical protein